MGVSYTIGAGCEVFVARNLVPTINNAPVTLVAIDFPDFTATENVRWTFSIYGASDVTHGVRFDDIKFFGATQAVSTEPAGRAFFRVRLLP